MLARTWANTLAVFLLLLINYKPKQTLYLTIFLIVPVSHVERTGNYWELNCEYVICTCNPCTREVELDRFLGLNSQPVLDSVSQKKKKKRMTTPEEHPRWISVFAFPRMHMYLHTPEHIHIVLQFIIRSTSRGREGQAEKWGALAAQNSEIAIVSPSPCNFHQRN